MSESPKVLIITCMKDEGPNLLHWIAHHRAAGADHILAYTNDCSDGTDTLLDLLEAEGIVTHERNRVPPGKSPQWTALKHAANHPRITDFDWVVVLDCDEYVNLRWPLNTFQDLIAALPDSDAIVLPWRLFGNAGHIRRLATPPTEAFDRAIAPESLYPPLSRFFKTLYRRKGPFQAPGVHRPKQKAGLLPSWRDGSGHLVPPKVAGGKAIMLWGYPYASDLVQLNHYSVRSAGEFLLKSMRGLPNRTGKPVDLAYWVERNFNDVEDRSINRMKSRTDFALAELRAISEITAIEAESITHHDNCLEKTLGDRSNVVFYGNLLMTSSRPPGTAQAQSLVHLYQAARDGGPSTA